MNNMLCLPPLHILILAASLLPSLPAWADDYTELHGSSAVQAKTLAMRGMADSYRQHWTSATINDCKGVTIGSQSNGSTNNGLQSNPSKVDLSKNVAVHSGLGGAQTIVTGAITNVCNSN